MNAWPLRAGLAAILCWTAAHSASALDPGAAQKSPFFAPPFTRNVQGTGTAGIDNGTLFLSNRPRAFEGTPTLRIDRHALFGSGKSGNTYKALWVLGTAGAENRGYEWTITGQLHNRALASGGAQNVAVNGTVFKEVNGQGPVGPSWGGNFVCNDKTGEPDPVASCIGAELNVWVKTPSTDKNRQRVALQLSTGGSPGTHVGRGILISVSKDSVMDRAVEFSRGQFGLGLDLSAATFSGPAIGLATRQRLAFDTTPDGASGRSLQHSGEALTYVTPSGPVLAVSDSGAVVAGGKISGAALGGSGSAPRLENCGSRATLSSSANTTHGTLTLGDTAPVCRLIFASPLQQPPDCILAASDGKTVLEWETDRLSLTLRPGAAKRIVYHCLGG